MAVTLYTYTKSANVVRLEAEIKADTSITTGVHALALFGTDTLKIWMKDALSSGEEDALDALVTAHDGTPEQTKDIVWATNVENEKFVSEGMDLTYRMKPFLYDIPATAGPHTYTISFPFPIMLLGGTVDFHTAMVGDSMKFETLACTQVGVLTAPAAEDDEVIYLNEGAMQYMYKGFDIVLGSDTEASGRIIEVYADSVKLDTPLAKGYSAMDPVKLEYEAVEKYYISTAPMVLWISRDTDRGAIIGANQEMKFYYYNDTTTAKKVQISLEYYS